MAPVVAIGFWAFLFVCSHLLTSSDRARPALIRGLGAQPYRGVYSLVALAPFTPLVFLLARHKHAGPMLWYLRDIEPIRWLSWILMLLAFILFVGSFVSPNPGAIGAPSGQEVRGILKITRHPSFVAIAIFALDHLLMNGWLGDLIFFGSLALLSIIGGIHQDARKLAELGEPYRRLLETTSFFPGMALARGRQHWTPADTPWLALGGGVVVTVVVLIFHPFLFGGNPLG
jgi:uncharacterized membrane protein